MSFIPLLRRLLIVWRRPGKLVSLSEDYYDKIDRDKDLFKARRLFFDRQYLVAGEYMKSCLQRYPDNFYARYWYALCITHQRRKPVQGLLSVYLVVALNPAWYEDYHLLGRLHIFQRNTRMAIRALSKALDLRAAYGAPESASLLQTMGTAQFHAKNYSEAVRFYWDSLLCEPMAGALRGLQRALAANGEKKKAIHLDAILDEYEPLELAMKNDEATSALMERVRELL